jgi:hypothetical protein
MAAPIGPLALAAVPAPAGGLVTPPAAEQPPPPATGCARSITADRREEASGFWETRLRSSREAPGHMAALDELRRDEIVRGRTCVEAANDLLTQGIVLLIAGADDLAHECLSTAQFYFETAIRTGDLGHYRRLGQERLGASRRLRGLCLTRWINSGRAELDVATFAQAVRLGEEWHRTVFARGDWCRLGHLLGEWLAEKVAIGKLAEAREILRRYYWCRVLPRQEDVPAEEVLSRVVDSLLDPSDLTAREAAEHSIDSLYRSFTDWGPGFDEHAIPYDAKLVYAYIRGKHFKGVEDPVRLIKMMRFSE